MEPPNKGHFGSRAFVLFSEVVLWWEVHSIAIPKTYRIYGVYILVQEAKELAEIQDIKHSFMVCSMPVMEV